MNFQKLNIKTNKHIKKKYLNYLGFIKFLAMILIIKWHIEYPTNWSIDIGSRMCELLFISSGFLVGYNYYNSPINTTYEYSFKYLYKHLKSFYPLYFLNLIYTMIYNKIRFNNVNRQPFSFLSNIEIFLIKITFSQCWSKYITSSYFNDHTWFLADLMFCYFLSPFLLKGIKNIRLSFILFIIILFARSLVELFLKNGAFNFFDTKLYYSPIIRMFEFYLGMLTIPLYYFIKSKIEQIRMNRFIFKMIFTFIQILVPILLYSFLNKYKSLYRFFYIILFCIFVLLISYDYGYLSDIISQKLFVNLMSCQFEMYLLQFKSEIFFKYLKISYFSISNNLIFMEFIFHLKLVFIFLISYTYKIMFKQKLATFLDNIIVLISKLFN